jgi:hypothetical protein
MTTGFGFCPNCGTPRIAAEQRFCAGCGATLSPSEPMAPVEPMAPPAPAESAEAAAAVQPAPAEAAQPAAPPAAPPTAVPPAPPAWAVASPAAATAGAPVPAAPSAPAKPLVTIGSVNVTPKMAAIAGIALAAILVAGYFVTSGSKSSGITVTPSTYSCSSTTLVTVVMRLPATVKATDPLVIQQDGKTVDTTAFSITVKDLFTLQPDGTWMYTRSDPAKSNCTGSSGETLAIGTHTVAILDTAGHVLAQGSFTLTP